jgi:hypothetical protein
MSPLLVRSLALSLLATSLAACGDDVLSPSRPIGRGDSTAAVDTTRPTPDEAPDSGQRVSLLLELQRVDGAPLPVTVLDREGAGAPRLRLDAYAGGLLLFADGTYRSSIGLTAEVGGVAQPVRVVDDSGTYRVGIGRITLVPAVVGTPTRALALGADSTWTVEQALVDGAAPARFQFGTAATRPPVMPLSGRWSFAVAALTDGAVRCTLRGFGWELVERDGAIAGESTAESGRGAGMDCAVVGRVPPFVTPTYGAGMPVTGRIVGDRVVLESRSEDGEGTVLLA